jgi:hypothetical protein
MNLARIRRFWSCMFLIGTLIVAGCEGDPDPCDPDCPVTTENPSGD